MAAEKAEQTELRRATLGRTGFPQPSRERRRRRRGPGLPREDGASREMRLPRLPVAIAAGDEGARGEVMLRAAAGPEAGR